MAFVVHFECIAVHCSELMRKSCFLQNNKKKWRSKSGLATAGQLSFFFKWHKTAKIPILGKPTYIYSLSSNIFSVLSHLIDGYTTVPDIPAHRVWEIPWISWKSTNWCQIAQPASKFSHCIFCASLKSFAFYEQMLQ